MVIACDPLIPLRDGPVVPESVLLWMSAAEDRGLRFRAEPDGRLHVGPRDCVQAEDLTFVRAHRDTLLECVRYIDRLCSEALP
jgi:hypothetical protein